MIQGFDQIDGPNILSLKNINKYVLNEKHKLVLKFILIYGLTPHEVRMITLDNVDLIKKSLNIPGKSISLNNDAFWKELEKYVKEKTNSKYLFDGRVKDVPMTRLNVHRICENSVKKIASHLNVPLTKSYSPIVLRETKFEFYEKVSNNLTNSRQEVLNKINNLILKKRNILVLGEQGVGKSYLIRLVNSKEKLLFIDDFFEFKKTLLNWILSLYDNDKVLAQNKLVEFSEQSKVKVLNYSTIPHLIKFINSTCANKDYIIIIDSIDSIPPRAVKNLDLLKETFCIVAAAREIPKKKENFFWDFEVITLQNLNRSETTELIEGTLSPIELKNLNLTELTTHIYQNSDGNPKKINEFIKRLRNEKSIHPANLNEVIHDRGKAKKSIGWLFLLILVFLLPLRYIYSYTGNYLHKVIGTTALVLLIVFRFYKSIRSKN